MSEKSHVGMEAKVCPVCGVEHTTGTLFLNKRLSQTLPRHVVTGYELCEAHQALADDGYIALVGCDPEKSNIGIGGMKMEDAYRTGSIAHIRREAFDRLIAPGLGQTADEVGPMVFVEEEVVTHLQIMMAEVDGDKFGEQQ